MTEKPSKTKLVYETTQRIIYTLSQSLDTSRTKSTLSSLRNSIGKPISNSVDALQLIYEYMPDELISYNTEEPTRAELAIMNALQLYALHQQSNHDSVNTTENESWNNIGNSLSSIRGEENKDSLDRRFNALITSQTFEELTHHLRQMIKLYKSKDKGAKINYGRVAEDLYTFLQGNEDSIRLRWARGYYRVKREKGVENNEQ